MAYIVVTKERPDGHAQLCERVGAADFEADHFRNCLSDRLAWAVEDAERERAEIDDAERERAADEPGRVSREVPAHVLANV
jgi:hypothetical protein